MVVYHNDGSRRSSDELQHSNLYKFETGTSGMHIVLYHVIKTMPIGITGPPVRVSRSLLVAVTATPFTDCHAMKFYLFNLTSESLFIRPQYSKHAVGSTLLPNAVVALPTSEDNVTLSSSGGSPDIMLEKSGFEPKTKSQYVVYLKKSSVQWDHVSLSEACPWRVYRDQVASLVLL